MPYRLAFLLALAVVALLGASLRNLIIVMAITTWMIYARVVRGLTLSLREQEFVPLLPGERTERVMCRMRSLGCSPCTGAVRSTADTVPKIIQELISVRQSERQLRVIDHDQDGSMEMKKREGYF